MEEDALRDRLTQAIREAEERRREYERLIAHLQSHDCSKEDWVRAWDQANLEHLRSEGGQWFYEWQSDRAPYDGRFRSSAGPDPDAARALNSEAAHAFARELSTRGPGKKPKFAELAEVTFRFGRIHSYVEEKT